MAEIKSDPIEFETVVVCDSIRQENTGKHILIGVYGINIRVVDFPANMRLSWFMIVVPKTVGSSEAEFRIVGPHDVTLVQGELGVNVKELNKPAILRMDNMSIQLQAEGDLNFQIKFKESDWRTIKKISVLKRSQVSQKGIGAEQVP
jgi:hypothetical protein